MTVISLKRPSRGQRPPAVGCAHRNCDPQSIRERWEFVREWMPKARFACVCCSGPCCSGPGERCAACVPRWDELISEILSMEV